MTASLFGAKNANCFSEGRMSASPRIQLLYLPGNFCRHARRLLTVFEELNLAQSFLRRLQGLVRPAKIFPLAGKYFVTRFNFFNHFNPGGFSRGRG